MAPIKVVLADDHTLFREGLKRLLARQRDLLVTGEAERAEEVGPAVVTGQADVLLLDLRMPGGEAVQTLLRLRQELPETGCLILTAYEDPDSIVDTAKAGARGYMLKDAAPEALFQAIRTIHEGGLWIDEKLPRAAEFAAIAAAQYNAEPPPDEMPGLKSLSRRELEVLTLLADGCSNDEIANRTFISERTVRAHVTSIFAKLRVDNRVKAALAFLRDPPTPPVSLSPRRPGGPPRGR
ncbi:MAG: response regulator transcription factor [Deltaproteobacteria bacterium]|nr:response regulator transcription factor [Deltaproteobacteria bacterium]